MRVVAATIAMLFVLAACSGGNDGDNAAIGVEAATLPAEAQQALDAAIRETDTEPVYQLVSARRAPNAQNLPGAANPESTEVWCVILDSVVPAVVLRPIASGQPGESPIDTVIGTHFSLYRFGQGPWVVSAAVFSNWPEIGCEGEAG